MENEKGEELARIFLKRLRRLSSEVRSLKETYNQLRADLRVLKAIDYSKDRVDGGRAGDPGDLIVHCMDIETELKAKIQELLQIKHRGFQLIKEIHDPVSATILLLRYVNNRPWYHIQKQMNYEEAQMFRLHRKAVKDFSEIYKDDSK